ncbi:hypothetical protein CHLNCDRAFT_138426 [Chlorella variabilis]|uniref:glycerophosphodiester phosphodiesterase n=1 Tax=Chlorella variabilis TaxID=554065 RepID=E1ZN14_CHLVA|nr:hypothetical protein CHLNCDRAFT_138426 [Chlorella variabilis]EFN52895.1 hypothetical protein CHLNCDRAFT_138426 [Chlorella variabilis]|eukprot:XP_005844997.1 hypothetical protein CHLNCDRAFT_138426 [Chlorella variabilis]
MAAQSSTPGACTASSQRPGGSNTGRSSLAMVRAAPTATSSVDWPQLKPFAGMLDVAADTVALGGHRGMGANVWHPSSSQPMAAPFRENTLLSFKAASESGATFLEFDVQVCADGVPVIWHDNYVVFGDEANPTSCRIADLTSQAFRQLAPINVSRATAAADTGVLLGGSPTSSSASLASLESFACSTASSAASAATSTTSSGTTRLLRKHRNDTPAEPHEPTLRSWQCEQEDHFPTLAEVFAGIPPSVAFDLEIKMAVPDDVVVTPAHEVDRMVSATLAAVDAGLAAHGPRTIMFSSFDPEVCLEVKRRRPGAVVMFLSGGGQYSHVDLRRTSIAAAVAFASGAALQGVILNTRALQLEAHMVEEARSRGLRVMTYGQPNDNPEWVRYQHFLGVQGVIVDDVAGVASALATALG